MQTSTVNPAALGNFELSLRDGRTIWLSRIVQWRTYAGMLFGYPTRHGNEHHIDYAKRRAADFFDNALRRGGTKNSGIAAELRENGLVGC